MFSSALTIFIVFFVAALFLNPSRAIKKKLIRIFRSKSPDETLSLQQIQKELGFVQEARLRKVLDRSSSFRKFLRPSGDAFVMAWQLSQHPQRKRRNF